MKIDSEKSFKIDANLSSCLVPDNYGVLFSSTWRESLWDRFCTLALQQQRQWVEQYKIVKKA